MGELVVTTAGAESLDRLEPLWGAMFEHHRSLQPRAASVRPFRAVDDSWRRRRAR